MSKKSYPHLILFIKILNKAILCLISLLLTSNKSIAQRANNWYFPTKKSLTFNTNPPSFIGNSQSFFSGAASISDNNGSLLFYSDARRVFNKKNQIMPNGDNIKGASSFIVGLDQALVIPHPGFSNLYYLFTNETNDGSVTGYYYHIIDMNANSGLGDVVLKNKLLYSNSGMRMTAAPMADGVGYWIITMEYRRKILRNFKITCLGLDLSPVIDTLDVNFIGNSNFDVGDMKASTSGNLLTFGNYTFNSPPGFGTTEIYNFNNLTGKTTSKCIIPMYSSKREFSPNSKFLFYRSSESQDLYQFDISSFDSATIFNSKVIIGQGYATQLGPDGRIYTLNQFDTLFSYIEKPNLPFPACNFVSRVIPIEGNGFMGINGSFFSVLPFFVPSLLANQNVQIPTYTLASNCRTVTLTGKTYIKGNNLSFKWYFGDGDSAGQIVPSGGDTTFTTVTHFFPLGKDTFNVQLFVTSDTVCGQGSAGKQVIVKPPPPTAKFGVSNLCNNLIVNFSDSSLLNFNPSVTYEWQFFTKQNVLLGSSSVQNPSFSFPAYDTFKVRLIARSFLSCVEADTLIKTIILKSKPTASFTYTNSCGSLLASFINNSVVTADTLSSYYWSFGGGNTSIKKNPSFSFAAFGDYIVKLVVASSQGCVSDTFSFPVSIKDKPIANIVYGNDGCAGKPVFIQGISTVAGTTINKYYWQLPTGASFTTPSITPVLGAGNYNIKYVVTTIQGCTSDTAQQPVLVENFPLAIIVKTGLNMACMGLPFSITDSSKIAIGQITNWAWQVGTQSSTAQNPSFTFSSFGMVAVTLVVTSKNGCVSNKDSLPIPVETIPVANFTNNIACINTPVTFINTSTNVFGAIASTQWLINNQLVSNNPTNYTHTFTQKGNYSVALKLSTASGCTATETKTIVVDNAIANAGKDFSVIENQPFVLQGSGGVKYYWHPSTGLSDTTIASPTGKLSNNQLYSLKITTTQGCMAYDTVVVTVLRNLIIPNAFSPNNDGINDVWTIEQLRDYPNTTIQIFNRTGQLVFTKRGNNPQVWNGFINNQPATIGAYYYVINLNNSLLNKPFSGVVMVLR